ncbi:hypothetical protein [Agrobacterium sp.]|uniref:hypothetical protein n=1 Tax=Agrobacterium sp. TaxID=361 RepID=UPI0025BA8200|nr:hypothetical protein [Agrobacterium sp.]MCD4663119.1 hypothetical protein [Agrobacterium sp.]
MSKALYGFSKNTSEPYCSNLVGNVLLCCGVFLVETLSNLARTCSAPTERRKLGATYFCTVFFQSKECRLERIVFMK